MRILANDAHSRLFAAECSHIYYDMRIRAAVMETDRGPYIAPGLSASQADELIRTMFLTDRADLTPYGKVYTEEEYAQTDTGIF